MGSTRQKLEMPERELQRSIEAIAQSWQFEDKTAAKLKEKLGTALKALASPVLVVFIISLLLVVVNILIAQHSYTYNSDDVSWQTTLDTWRPFSGQRAYVGAKDNFLANVPVMLVFQHIFHMTRAQLLAEALFFAICNFVLFFVAALYFLKKAHITPGYSSLTPFIWLASFGTCYAVVFLNPNWRGYEFGLSFFTYMVAAKYYFGELSPYVSVKSKFYMLLLFALAVIFTYSDPYYFYFALFPVAAAFAILLVLKKVSRPQAYTVVGFALLTLAFARLLTSVMARVGIFAPQGALSLTTIHNLHRTVDQLLQALGNLFSIDFSQDKLMALGNLLLLAAVVTTLAFFAIKRTPPTGKIHRQHGMLRFFSLLGIFSIIAYIAIGNAVLGNARYLVPFVYSATMVLAIALGMFGPAVRRVLLIVLVATTALNITISLSQLQDPAGLAGAVNHDNYVTISRLEDLGLTKGYTGYWNGNINTYLSKDAVTFLPVTCFKDRTIPMRLLVNFGLFSHQVPKTFYLIDPSHTDPPVCTESQLIKQFGEPEQTVRLDNKTILVWNYDIYAKMPQQV